LLINSFKNTEESFHKQTQSFFLEIEIKQSPSIELF